MKRITAPDVDLVTLAEAKKHLHVSHLADDTLITAQIAAVHDILDGYEGQLGRAIAPQTWEFSIDCFPRRGFIRLPLVPFVHVTGIKYDDLDDVEQMLDMGLVKIKQDHGFGCVMPALNAVWPDFREVRVTYEVGLDPTSPSEAKRAARISAAMLLLIGDLYDNRSAQIEGRMVFENPAVRRLLEPLRVRSWQ